MNQKKRYNHSKNKSLKLGLNNNPNHNLTESQAYPTISLKKYNK